MVQGIPTSAITIPSPCTRHNLFVQLSIMDSWCFRLNCTSSCLSEEIAVPRCDSTLALAQQGVVTITLTSDLFRANITMDVRVSPNCHPFEKLY
jgi:hypothetical protein